MTCDPDDSEKLRKLAEEIAECIISGGVIDESAGDSLVTERRICPPNKLCCFAGYKCTVPFYCDDYFGCINRFSVGSRTA